MATVIPFSTQEKTSHNSHKFAFTLKLTNYGNWKTMIQPFLVTNNMFGYIDGSISCPRSTIEIPASGSGENAIPASSSINPNYTAWVANDAHVRMLLISTIAEESFNHIKGITSMDLWNHLERAYAPHTQSQEYTLKTKLLKLTMNGDETPTAYLARAQEYATDLLSIGKPFPDEDLVMLIIVGLRDEYNGLKSNLLGRQIPTTIDELPGLLSDHDYMITKHHAPGQANSQAYTVSVHSNPSTPTSSSRFPPPPSTELHNLHQLAAQHGYQLTPTVPPQANYTVRNNRGRGSSQNIGRGRTYSPRPPPRERAQFDWAPTQILSMALATAVALVTFHPTVHIEIQLLFVADQRPIILSMLLLVPPLQQHGFQTQELAIMSHPTWQA